MGSSAEIASVVLSDGTLEVRNDPDGLNLVKMAGPLLEGAPVAARPVERNPAEAGRAGAGPAVARPAKPYQFVLHELKVANAAVEMVDVTTKRPVRLSLKPLDLTLRNVSSDPKALSGLSLSTGWEDKGSLKFEGSILLQELALEGAFTASDLALAPLDPYIEPSFDLRITGGTVSGSGHTGLKRDALKEWNIAYKGDLRLDGFAAIDGVHSESFLSWKSLRVTGLDFQTTPYHAAIAELAANDLDLRWALAANGRSNVADVLRLPAPAEKGQSLADVEAEPVEEAAAPAETPTAAPADAATAAAKTAAPASTELTTISVVRLENAQLRYLDRTVEPNVAFALTGMSGTVKGLSSDNLSRGDVDLRGKVDNVAPLLITGQLNPFAGKEATDLKFDAKGIELTPFGPYIGKYLGYNLQKGKLDLALRHKISEWRLDSANLANFDQFVLGDKTNSPVATHLPVKLGLALLRDRQGKIVLDVPVSGNLHDPKFRLGRVVLRAIVNIFKKIITSPFAALGSLFGKKDVDLSYVNFVAGGAELDAAALDKIATLAKAMFERPGLTLEIAGDVEPNSDREAIKRQQLDRRLRTAKWKEESARDPALASPEQVTLAADERERWLQKVFYETFPEEVPKPAPPPPKEEPRKRGAPAPPPVPAPPPPPTANEMEQRLLSSITVTPDDLRLLAADRAQKVRDRLLEGGQVAPERIYLTEAKGQAPPGKAPQVVFTLK